MCELCVTREYRVGFGCGSFRRFLFLPVSFFCGGSEICAGRDRLGQTWAGAGRG